MHKLGVVFGFLVIIAAGASTVLTAKLIQVRNSWAAKAQNFEKQYATTSADLTKARKEFLLIRDSIESTLRNWGSTYTAETQMDPSTPGRLQIDLGTNAGLKDQMVIHGFQLTGETSIYRGPFVVGSAQADRSVVTPAWRLRPQDLQAVGDVPTWQGGSWRWRTVIPSAYTIAFDEQVANFTKMDEVFGDRSNSLRVQQKLVEETQRQIALRTAELVGGPGLPEDASLKVEDRQGLEAAISEEEQQRRMALLAIAQLRQQVRNEMTQVQKLQAENLELANRLPQPVTTLSDSSAAK